MYGLRVADGESPSYGFEPSDDSDLTPRGARYDAVDQPTGAMPAVPYPPPRPRRLSSSALAVGASFLAVIALVAVGVVLLKPDPQAQTARPEPVLTVTVTATASPSATPTPTPTPSPTPTVARPTVRPPATQLPPPPPPAVTEAPSCTQWDEENDASPAQVRAALAAAGGHEFWPAADPPVGWPGGPLPVITIPSDLMNAVAFAESSWRSTVIACDGGIGLMQIMPYTKTFLIDKFNRAEDVYTVDGNARLGAMYLQWLNLYFGLFYFGSFDLDAVQPVGPGGAPLRLRDVVIAAYNVGAATVEYLNGTPKDSTDDYLAIPNQWYVDRVNNYRAACPCDAL
jgi:soluble lytic murein transglycosylase-like protein